MRKPIIILFIVTLLMVSCQTEKEYPQYLANSTSESNDVNEEIENETYSEETSNDMDIILNEPPLDERTYAFSSYDELLSVMGTMKESTNILKSEIQNFGLTYQTTVSAFETEKVSVVLPCADDSPFELRDIDGFMPITLFTNELYNLPWIWYNCQYNGYDFRVQISYVDILNNPQIDHSKSYLEILSVIAPSAPSPDNYTEFSSYKTIYEQEISLKDRSVIALISEINNSDNVYINFHIDGVLVILYGNHNLFTDEFLSSFNMKELQ